MMRIAAVLALAILCACLPGASAQSTEQNQITGTNPQIDWLGVRPIYSSNGLLSPYFPYYYPTYSYFLPGSQPAYFYPTYLVGRYSAYPWWIGEHGDLGKTMQVARYGSSMRVYSSGVWSTV